MRDEPSEELRQLLEYLQLASRPELQKVARSAHRLARGLPLFDSVWVDALVSRRRITPFQAAEINAQRGERLRVADYVLEDLIASHGFADCFLARQVDSGEKAYLYRSTEAVQEEQTAKRSLECLARQSIRAQSDVLPAIEGCGVEQGKGWIATSDLTAQSAGEWLIRNGRMPAEVVLEIARQIAAELASAEHHDLVHGDLAVAHLWLKPSGRVVIAAAGFRAILRPAEGYAHDDLPPEAYDSLAPERIEDGTPANVSSDLYAFGALLWHLLGGRSPHASGSSLAKLQSIQRGKIQDVRQMASDVPGPLVTVINACTQNETHRRPESFAKVASQLGPSTQAGREAFARLLARQTPQRAIWKQVSTSLLSPKHAPIVTAAMAGCLLMGLTISFPLWNRPASELLGKTASRFEEESSETELAASDARLPDEPQTTPVEEKDDVYGLPHEQPEGLTSPLLPVPREQEGPNRRGDVKFDSEVIPASAEAVVDAPGRKVLTLKNIHPIEASRLVQETNLTVRSARGQRAVVEVAEEGLLLRKNGMRFENIDFVAVPVEGRAEGTQSRTILRVGATNVEFIGCTFQTATSTFLRYSGLECLPLDRDVVSHEQVPLRLRLRDCLFQSVDAAVEILQTDTWMIRCENVLQVGGGPFCRIADLPSREATSVLSLQNCTLRGAASLVDLTVRKQQPELAGRISVQAVDSLFSLQHGSALLRIVGTEKPDRAASRIDWRVQGSILDRNGQLAQWYDAHENAHSLDKEKVWLEGLVQAPLDFVGDADSGPAASLLKRGAVPSSSEIPPGVRAARLSGPSRQY